MQTSVLLFMYSNYALPNPDLHFRVFVGSYDFCVDNSVPYLHCVLFQSTRGQKLELQLVGLGRKKIVFGSRHNAVKVKEKLEKAYPKLKKGEDLKF